MKKINFNSDWRFTFEANLEDYNTFGFLKYADTANATRTIRKLPPSCAQVWCFEDGLNEICVVASVKEGQSVPFSGYVKIGCTVNEPWQVRLHYGLARVFVRSSDPDSLQIALTER